MQSKSNTLSVVIPLFNKAATVRRAIESVLAQRDVVSEIIVVDDGSSDDSVAVVRSIKAPIILVEQANAGPSTARNTGAAIATAPFIAFLDADDEYTHRALSTMLSAAERSFGNVVMGSFDYVSVDGDVTEELIIDRFWKSTSVREELCQLSCFSAKSVINVHISCACISRDLYNRIGGFDAALRSWEITDFFLRLALEDPRFVVLADRVALVHQTPNSASTITHGETVYLARYLEKLFNVMPRVPRRERNALLRGAKSLLRAIWANEDLATFQRLARRALPYMLQAGQLDKVVGYGVLPLRMLPRLPPV